MVGHPLEHGEVVVVQAPHQAWVDAVRQVSRVQNGAHSREVSARRLPQVFGQFGGRLDEGLQRRVLGVQDAKRVGVQAAPAVFVQLIGVPCEVINQRRAMRCTFVGLAQTVEFQPHMLAHAQAQRPPQAAHHQDEFGIYVRAGVAQGFHVQLVELAVSTPLRPFVPKDRADGPYPHRPVVQRVVLDHGAHDPRRDLRAKSQLIAVHRVLPGVHLLLDDIRGRTYAAHEQGRGLHDGREQVLVTVQCHDCFDAALEPAPCGGIRQLVLARNAARQDVVHAFDGNEFFGHGRSGARGAASRN